MSRRNNPEKIRERIAEIPRIAGAKLRERQQSQSNIEQLKYQCDRLDCERKRLGMDD